MAAPTLETNAAADTLRIMAGTAGNPVTWNDVWDWDDGGGSSGGDGDVPKDGGGTARVDTFMTETIPNVVYLILKSIQFGNDVTPSYFRSKNEMVYFSDDMGINVRNAATLELGEIVSGYSENGSRWNIGVSVNLEIINSGKDTAYFYMYDSYLYSRGKDFWFRGGNVILKKSTHGFANATEYSKFWNTMNSLTMDDVYFFNTLQLNVDIAPDDFKNVHVHDTTYGFKSQYGGTIENLLTTNFSSYDVDMSAGYTVNLKNPLFNITTPLIDDDSGIIKEQYTCNAHIANKDGADLAGVAVDCKDQFGNPVWAVGTVITDAAGDIAEQIITYKKWEGTDETLTEYSPHIFTISKAGYETQVLDEITVDHPIVWHEELLPELAEANVEVGVNFGENKIGTYAILTGENLTAYLKESVDLVGYLEKKVELSGELKS